jgi:hypothetical protein
MTNHNIHCSFCSDVAAGYDSDGEPTCGADTCEPVVAPFPRVIEVSGDDDDEIDC